MSSYAEIKRAVEERYGVSLNNFKTHIIGSKVKLSDLNLMDKEQVLMGIEVEKEHTTDIFTALEITIIHIKELKNYYTLLKRYVEKAK